MKQSKTQSLKETVTSTFIGLAVSLITHLFYESNIITIARGYLVRRYFNRKLK